MCSETFLRLNYIETLKGIKNYNRIKLNTLCALKNKVSNYGFNSSQCIVRCFTYELKINNRIKWKYVLCLKKSASNSAVKLWGFIRLHQTLRFHSFAFSKIAVSMKKIIRKSWQKSRNCETISLLNRGFARLKWLRKVSIRLWKSGVVIGSLKWFFWWRPRKKY